MAALPLLGFGFAHWEYALDLRRPGAALAVTVCWMLLHAGSMWLNADFDRDDGPVVLGSHVKVPPFTRIMGLYAIILGSVCALAVSRAAGVCAVGCGGLAVAYSSRSFAWKAQPVAGPVVNGVGYGLLSPAAGWSLVGVPPNARTVLASIVVVALILSLYFAAQAFQGVEDQARGYRTLVVTHGSKPTLQVSRALLALGSVLVIGMVVADWLPKLCVVIFPAWITCDRWLLAWLRSDDGGGKQRAEGYVVRLLALGLVIFVAALVDYGIGRVLGGPVAGLARPTT